MDDAVEDRVGQRRVADQVVPAIHRDLAGDQRGAAAVALLDDLEQIVTLLGAERLEPPIVEGRGVAPTSFTPASARISLA